MATQSVTENLIRASGLWEDPAGEGRYTTLLAFYNRPWQNLCTLDQVIDQALKHDIDPVPLLKMVEFAGEIDLSPRYPGTSLTKSPHKAV